MVNLLFHSIRNERVLDEKKDSLHLLPLFSNLKSMPGFWPCPFQGNISADHVMLFFRAFKKTKPVAFPTSNKSFEVQDLSAN